MKELKPPRAISESSTTSDNTSEFIDIVKKYDVVYNTHNPDYKNVEVKMKVWSQIAEEIGLSVEASKRKWKNLRDSYTKYLRSFRIGTKTSKKYQYWAHADHMEFLKPYQGPGRNSVHNNGKSNDEDDTECDLGFQVLAKATTSSSEEDLKINVSTNSVSSASTSMANTTPNIYTTAMNAVNLAAAAAAAAAALSIPVPLPTNTTTTTAPSMISPGGGSVSTNSNVTPISNMTNASQNASSASALVMPLPALPAVSLPPPGQQQLSSAGKQALTAFASLPTTALPLSASAASQMFPLAPLNASTAKTAAAIPIPVSSTASSVGCLIIEPHLFASADTFKKELSSSSAALGLFHNLTNPATVTSMNATTSRTNPPLFTKIRRVQPSPQTAAINLSFSATGGSNSSGVGSSSSTNQPPAAKSRKTSCPRNSGELDVNAVLQANRDLDANTLFFLSLARQVRAMPMKFQSLAKMRCMRIVSDIELELENVDCNGGPTEEGSGAANMKYCSIDTPPPPQMQDGISIAPAQIAVMNDASTEHFVYVMSPSRVESMIDISSDEDTTNLNGIQ